MNSVSNEPFSFAENRTFPLKTSKSFNAFKIEMIDTNTNNAWALCIGQIEVFGDIYRRPLNHNKCTKQIIRRKHCLLFTITMISE